MSGLNERFAKDQASCRCPKTTWPNINGLRAAVKKRLVRGAQSAKNHQNPLGEILIAHALSPETSVLKALATQSGKAVANTNAALGAFESDDPLGS